MARLALCLLGPFQVRFDGQPVPGLHADSLRALLAFLAVEADKEHTRQSLASLLWPEQPEHAARNNLRYALSDLRRALGDTPALPATPILVVTRDCIRLDPSADFWLDVREFAKLCRAPAQREDAQAECTRLEEAVGLYRGPFLEGFSLPGSAAFEEWLFWTREQFQRKMVDTLRALTAWYTLSGRYELAQVSARQQVHLDSLDEESHRELIMALALSGDRSAALTQAESCRRILAKELDVELMPETVALIEAIRSGALERPITLAGMPDSLLQDYAPDRAPSHDLVPAPVFVARQRELAQLERHLVEALDGRGRVVFVTGDAGSGKTALMREFVNRALAAHTDLVAASGDCDAATGVGDPYLPFRQILQMLAGDIEARRAGGVIMAEHARRLWSLLPHTVKALVYHGPDLLDLFVPGEELLLRADSVMLGSGTGAAWRSRLDRLVQGRVEQTLEHVALQQSHVCEQVSRVLRDIAQHSPLVLMLDDLQWVDNASISVLFHLGRQLEGSRILVLGAFRSPDVGLGLHAVRHPLATVINELQRSFGEIRVDLQQAADRAFLDAYLDREPNLLNQDFRDTLFQHTSGHALFTIELLREMQARGDLARDAEGRWIEASGVDWGRIPPRVEAVIAERIGRLPQDMQTLLTVASVEGDEFTAEILAHVLGYDRAKVLSCLSDHLGKEHKLVRADRVIWLESGKRSLSRYRFQHFLFHEYLYQRLDPVERTRLHQLTGEALEQLYGVQAPEIAVQLARHYEQAGLATFAVDQLLTAAKQALRLAADREAVATLNHALHLLATLPATPERTQRELDLRLAIARPLGTLYGLGDTKRAEALIPTIGLSRLAGGGIQTIYALYLQADVHRGQGNFGRAIQLGQEMLAQAEASGDRQAAMLAYYTLGATAGYSGDVVEARSALEMALQLYREEDHRLAALFGLNLQATALALLSMALWILGFAEQAATYACEAIRLAQSLGQAPTLSMVLALVIWPWIMGHNGRDARAWIEAYQRLVNETEVEALSSWAHAYNGWLLASRGQVAEGVAQIHRSIPDWRTGGIGLGAPMLFTVLAQTCLEAALYDEGLAAVNEALGITQRGFGHAMEAELHRLQGALMLGKHQDGYLEMAEASFLTALDLAGEQQALSWELRAMTDLARLWQRRGRGQAAHRRLAAVYGRFSEGFETPDLCDAAALLGELAGALCT